MIKKYCVDCGAEIEFTGRKIIIDDGEKETENFYYCEEHLKKTFSTIKNILRYNQNVRSQKVRHAAMILNRTNFLKINSKSMELKPGPAEPKSANPLPLLWASIKYLVRHPLARSVIISGLLVIAVIVGGNFLLQVKLPAEKVQVKLSENGKPVLDSNLKTLLGSMLSVLFELKAHFVITDENGKPAGQQIGNVGQYIKDEIATQLKQKGL